MDENGGILWIFLEDAGEREFSPQNDSHRVLAAQWLGELHRSDRQTRAVDILPARDPAYYLALRQEGRDNIMRNMENQALTLEYSDTLRSVITQIETVEVNWGRLAKICQGFPRTMVHADFQPKSIRVKRARGRQVLFVIDWEMAGWGIPIVDVAPSHGMSSTAEVDLSAYLDLARENWQNLDMPTLQLALHIGCIYRRLAAVYWSSQGLSYEWLDEPVLSMQIYQKELDHALAHVLGEQPGQ